MPTSEPTAYVTTYSTNTVIASFTISGDRMRRPRWLYETTTRAESGASVSFTVATSDLMISPMRLNLMPPDVDPAPPPTAISAAMTRNAPEVSDVVSWFVVMF